MMKTNINGLVYRYIQNKSTNIMFLDIIHCLVFT
jgi:hypothetical protein